MKGVIFSFSFLILITPFLSPKEKEVLPELDKEELILLGESLFFDPILSKDQSISCASCHLPEYSFSDSATFSRGVGGLTLRNTPTIINLAHRHGEFNWDGRFKSLETQVLHAIQNPLEMGANLDVLEHRLDLNGQFPENVVRALAAFIRTLEYQDSKYDRVLRGEENFTLSEERGWAIFFDAVEFLPNGECSHCHTDPLFSSEKYFNNGLDESFQKDQGRGGITGNPYEIGMFRTPTLRNIELTAPYMHDGRFQTLEEVVHHYNSGGKLSFNANANILPLNLTDQDQSDLIAFLKTLTDHQP
jgi:cytochrome c peroxidase